MKKQLAILLTICLLSIIQTRPLAADPAGAEEQAARDIIQLHETFAEIWLRNDESVKPAIMALFHEDAVILPHHGDPMRIGKSQISKFWWPEDAPPAEIEEFSIQPAGVVVDDNIGYSYSRFTLIFTSGGKRYSNGGNELMIARRTDDGTWKIHALMWNDPWPEIEDIGDGSQRD